MRYISTRGETPPLAFQDAVLTGLAPDGGLLVPDSIPDVGEHLDAWRGLSFIDLAKRVLPLFVDDIDSATLNALVDEAYADFDVPETVVLRDLGDVDVLELFHGPTLAFKDVALQLLGKLFQHILASRSQHLNIVGATSGDTGSAAIAGVRGQNNVDIFVMFPQGRVSPLQERQMTTILDANVHCLAVKGSFDDCQNLMKTLFADLPFKARHNLGAVNSVNWARVLAQIVYYGYASLALTQHRASVSFCVPTGNFGNIFAGYLAKRMGFPIGRLLLATNENDILARFFASGTYARGDVRYTVTPSMDIQVASNFERFLFYHLDCDSERLRRFMHDFASAGTASVPNKPGDDVFRATAVTEQQTLDAIRRVYAASNYVADPHTAVGIAAAEAFADEERIVCVGTAHPAKFPDAVAKALGGHCVSHPRLDALADLPTRCETIEPSLDALKRVVEAAAR